MSNGFNFFTTNPSCVLRSKLIDTGSFLKNIPVGDRLFEINKNNGINSLCFYKEPTAGNIDEYSVIDSKKFAISFDGDGYILLITNNLETDSSTSNLLEVYFSGSKLFTTSTGILLSSEVSGSPSDYGYFSVGTRKIKYVTIGGRKILAVKEVSV